MTTIQKILEDSKKIVIKLGSNVLSTEDGVPNREAIKNIVEQLIALIDDGKRIVIVSSGAKICGVGAINKWHKVEDMNYKQALCAIGQVELMMAYKEFFAERDLHVGQMLLTNSDFENSQRRLHIRNTMFTLIDEGVVPIVNENDTVSTEEFQIGDNDKLSALTASLWSADTLIMLSDIDGVFDKNPKINQDAKLLHEIDNIDKLMAKIDTNGKSSFGTGGINTKIEAARRACQAGVSTILLNGKKKDIITLAMDGKAEGTVFLCE